MSGVYDVFEDRYIDASEIDQTAPPERYKAITKDLLAGYLGTNVQGIDEFIRILRV